MKAGQEEEHSMANKLYIGSLSYDTADEELKGFFQQAGTVQSATVIIDRDSGRSKGFGFVEMSTDAETQRAIAELNGKTLGERVIRVEEARPARRNGDRSGARSDGFNDGRGRW
jgi:RNA recognition motif-containing protein